MKAINELVYKEMVANEQIGFHGAGWNFVCLNDKGHGKKRNYRGDNDGFKIFPDCRFAKFQRCFLQQEYPKAKSVA